MLRVASTLGPQANFHFTGTDNSLGSLGPLLPTWERLVGRGRLFFGLFIYSFILLYMVTSFAALSEWKWLRLRKIKFIRWNVLYGDVFGVAVAGGKTKVFKK